MKRFHRSRRKRPNLQEAEGFLKNGIGGGMRAEDFVSAAERKARLAQLAAELIAKIKDHLPRSRNLELVILKSHLILEYMFDQYIDLMAPTEDVMKSERFNFKQKEVLVHMLGFSSDPRFFPSVDLLNSVRNSVAHKLAIDREKIDHLIRINSENPNEVDRLTDTQRASALKQIVKFMCWQMLGFIEASHYLEWADKPKLDPKDGEQAAPPDGLQLRLRPHGEQADKA